MLLARTIRKSQISSAIAMKNQLSLLARSDFYSTEALEPVIKSQIAYMQDVQDTTLVSDLWQVGGFLRVLLHQ